ncbi:hypothetical protein KFE25_003542 [Diacronema lutheri]|uniref:WD repeat-containing protein 18 n=1 Tax=Diacronema lutheri TaxID=2081491 RepID=A0A8J5XPR8_DIALT|nr:hypothetical protein KFE25_003542 [Diacronema lutheri]
MAALEGRALLTTCPSQREVHVWDTRGGLIARTYKDCATGARGLAVVDGAHFVAAQAGKPQLHVYAWAREQPVFRCQTPEELRALVCTSDGAYCIGGGVSGRVYLWATRSGALLLAWDAHFKSVTALALTADDGLLVAGGADALVTVWSFADVLACAEAAAANASRARVPSPVWTWSAHSLGVTAVTVGAACPCSLVVSASLDQTVHVRELARGELLHVLRAPSAAHSVALSPCEHALFVGTADGTIHEATLVLRATHDMDGGDDRGGGGGSGLGRHGGGGGGASGFGVAPAAPPIAAASGGCFGSARPFATHGAIVHGVAVLGAGAVLATCGADGTVRAWDVRSRQQLGRMSAPHAHGPFEALLSVRWPPAGATGVAAAASLPVLPFKKYMDVASGVSAGASDVDLRALLGCVLARPAVRGAQALGDVLAGSAGGGSAGGGTAGARESAADDGEEVEALREGVRRWQAVANELYRVAVADILAEVGAQPAHEPPADRGARAAA